MHWRCPICQKATDTDRHPDFPFCSERCRLIDLGNWASEKYKVSEPATATTQPEGLEPEDHEQRNRRT